MQSKRIRVHLFGVMSLDIEGQSVPLPNSAVARRLLAYLLLQKDRSHSRTVVAGTFWAELSEVRARKALSQALWHIRKSLPDLLETSTEEIVVAEANTIWVDTHQFEMMIEAHLSGQAEASDLISLNDALELYCGDFLEGVYDDWALFERERYSDLYLQGLEKLAKLEKMSGDYQRALDSTQQLLKRRPYDEGFHQEAMRLYYLLGKADAALHQYESCCQMLRDEFDADPEAKTVLLAQEIANQSVPSTSIYLPKPLASQKPINLAAKGARAIISLIGREAPRDELLRHVEAIFQQVGGIALIEGEAGVGKTRLLREIVQDAEWRNAQTLWGYCLEQEAAQPFRPFVTAVTQGLSPLRVRQLSTVVDPLWLQVLKPLLPQIAQALPDLGAPPPLKPEQERARLIEAVASFLTGWSAVTPLLLIIEDLHWADEDTLRLLPVLQNRIQGHRILLIGTFRGEDARASSNLWKRLQALDRAGLRSRLQLDPLDQAATGKLIRRCLGLSHPAPVFEKRIYLETDGNPLFVLETLRTLQDEGLLVRDETEMWKTPWDDETADYAELPLPPMVEQVIARRLERLSPSSRQVFDAGVVLGHQFGFSLLAGMSELGTPEILVPIQDLLNRHLWEETEKGYLFSHDKVREVGLSLLDETQLRKLHHRVVDVYEAQAPENVDVLAYHCEQAGLWKKAAEYAYQAGVAAMESYAYTSARAHFEKTLDFAAHEETGALDRFELLTAYEKALDVLGDRDIQCETLEEMQNLAEGDTEKRYLVYLRQAWRLANISNFDDAQYAAKQALRLAEEMRDLSLQADALDVLGTALTWQGKNEEAIPHLEEAVSLAEKLGNLEREAHARSSLGSALLGVKDYLAARKELQASLQLAENNPRELADTSNLLGILYMEQGMAEEAIAAYQNSQKNSEQIGYLHGQGRALVNLGNLYYFRGNLSATFELYDQAISIFAQIEQKRGEVQLRLNRASMSQVFFGDSDQIVADAKYCLAYAQETGDLLGIGQALTILGESSRQQGDFKTARRRLAQGVEAFEKAGDRWMLAQIYSVQALLAITEGQFEQCLVRTSLSLEICEEQGMLDMISRLLTVRGEAFYGMEDYAQALETLSEAIDKITAGTERSFLTYYWYSKTLSALNRDEESVAAMQQTYQILQDTLENLSPEQKRLSWENVAEHREIITAWERLQPNKITVTMPKVGGGTVGVRWTVDAPEDGQVSGRVARRRHQLKRLLQEADEQGGAPTHQHLANALKTGLRTIERDMAALTEG